MRAAFISCAAALGLISGSVAACPQKLPSGMTSNTVGENVVVNGIGLQILQVESKEDVKTLFARLEKEWGEAGFAVKRNQAEGWSVLSALSDKCLTTLQLTDGRGSAGYLAVNRFAKPFAVRLPSAPVPSGATVLSNVLSDDDGRHGSTTLLSSTQSVDALADFYVKKLSADGWQAVRPMGMKGSDNKYRGMNISAQRGRDRIDVVIVNDEGSKVVVNLAQSL
jgi:hypothetical protein